VNIEVAAAQSTNHFNLAATASTSATSIIEHLDASGIDEATDEQREQWRSQAKTGKILSSPRKYSKRGFSNFVSILHLHEHK
jgi:hypothetical protein